MRRIDRWSIYREPFWAPEIASCIHGTCEGSQIRTSNIDHTEGRHLWTVSGSHYYLGDAHPEYLEFLAENDYPFDPENPIKKVDKLTELRASKKKAN